MEAALAVTEPTADRAANETANVLARIEDFAEAQANTRGVSGLCMVSSREQLGRLIEEYRAQDLPLGYDWERTFKHWEAIRNADPWAEDARRVSREKQAATLRDIIGNPLHLAPGINSAWLTWHDGTIPKLAQAIYEDRDLPSGRLDNHRLAVLADALEEAGCDDANILNHCRQLGVHVRGCWVVDLLLGKE
jgi:hypothetical protein